VVMAGGSGTRFWPWSRSAFPKQLLPLCGPQSMLADTVERVTRVVPQKNILIVTSAALRRPVERELPGLGRDQILCEPVGRNTAPCVAWAALEIARRDPDAAMLVLPADHVVSPLAKYLSDMELGLALAYAEHRLVTFGIPPTHPETGYGYLREGAPIGGAWSRARVKRVAAFHEKPTAARARKFLRGGFYWNSGMFAWRADVIREEIATHLPALAAAIDKLGGTRRGTRIAQRALNAGYPKLESISIDHGVMEKSARVAMVIAGFRWNDIGSWDAVGELWPHDQAGNASRDPLVAIDARNNVVASRSKPVALLGVNDLAVVDSGDALLICPRERAQDVRSVVAALERAKLGQLR